LLEENDHSLIEINNAASKRLKLAFSNVCTHDNCIKFDGCRI